MTIRSRRRPQVGSTLAEMSDDDLWEITYFSCLQSSHTVTYQATPDEQKRAWEILKERGAFDRLDKRTSA